MKFKVITLFPEFVNSLNNYSIIGRAFFEQKNELECINLRDFGLGNYKQVDDKPYGGGIGMLLRVDVAFEALKKAKTKSKNQKTILLAANGEKFTQIKAEEYSTLDQLNIFCGHYEGHDKRIESYVDEIISIGDFVVSGGEIPAMTIIDSTARLIQGVLGKDESNSVESFSKIDGKRILEYPQYTRPFEFDKQEVPSVLLSGDLKKIKSWQDSLIKKSTLK